MLQTLLETGARASELVQLRIEDVSLAERVITIRQGKGDKRREVPIRGSWPSCFGCISAPGELGRYSPAASKAPARRRTC